VVSLGRPWIEYVDDQLVTANEIAELARRRLVTLLTPTRKNGDRFIVGAEIERVVNANVLMNYRLRGLRRLQAKQARVNSSRILEHTGLAALE